MKRYWNTPLTPSFVLDLNKIFQALSYRTYDRYTTYTDSKILVRIHSFRFVSLHYNTYTTHVHIPQFPTNKNTQNDSRRLVLVALPHAPSIPNGSKPPPQRPHDPLCAPHVGSHVPRRTLGRPGRTRRGRIRIQCQVRHALFRNPPPQLFLQHLSTLVEKTRGGGWIRPLHWFHDAGQELWSDWFAQEGLL